MFPFLDISINGTQASLPLDVFLRILSLLILFMSLVNTIQRVSASKALLLTLVPSFFAVYGGGLFYHWIVDHQFRLQSEGQTYYGALLSQLILFYFLSRLILHEAQQQIQAMDAFSVASPFVYSLLRIGCFTNGCCYGKLCRYPWAVVFTDERSLTPLLGLPLHPTQLYSAIHGFLAGCIMVLFFRKRRALQLEGRLLGLLFILLGIGRIFIEPLRADLKNSLWLGVAINQWISYFVVLWGTCLLFRTKVWIGFERMNRFIMISLKKTSVFTSFLKTAFPFFLILLTLLFTACGAIPKPPGSRVVTQTTALSPGIFVHHMAHRMTEKPTKLPNNNRNLLFVVVDDFPENLEIYRSTLSKIYKTDSPPRMEEVLWWHYAHDLARLYREVVRIQYDSLDWEALFTALNYLESAQAPFDLFMLTHGIPNHLISSKKRLPISWKDLEALSGENHLQFMDTVFLQACFGRTLANDFKNMGANSVISFEGTHYNILFFDIFLKNLIENKGEGKLAFQKATSSFEKQITHNFSYRYFIKRLLKVSLKEIADKIRENGWMPALLESLPPG